MIYPLEPLFEETFGPREVEDADDAKEVEFATTPLVIVLPFVEVVASIFLVVMGVTKTAVAEDCGAVTGTNGGC